MGTLKILEISPQKWQWALCDIETSKIKKSLQETEQLEKRYRRERQSVAHAHSGAHSNKQKEWSCSIVARLPRTR
jgi:hypothetical protein